MPKKYKKKYPLARKNRKKNLRIPLGMPTSQLVRLRYVTEINLDAATSGLTAHYFSANGLYDPDISGVGHQPLYFDQYMAAYDHYRVLGSKIKVTNLAWGAETVNNIPGVFGVIIDDNSTFSYTSADEIIESNQAGTNNWSLYTNSANGMHAGGRRPSITRKFSTKKFFGRRASAGLTDDLRGSVSSNPAEQAYFGIWAGDVAGNDPTPTNFLVEIEYIAVLEEPKYIARS